LQGDLYSAGLQTRSLNKNYGTCNMRKEKETHTRSDPALSHEGVGTPTVEVWAGLKVLTPRKFFWSDLYIE